MTPVGEVVRHTILVPSVDRSGVVRKILGTSMDVTALRHTEAKLRLRRRNSESLWNGWSTSGLSRS